MDYFEPFFQVYIYVCMMIFGLCMGSFLNCLAYRICHNLSIVKGRSMCDHCGHVLGPLDLIPVFSYIFSGGKCRYCGKKLSSRYVFSEIITGLVYCVVVYRYGLSLETIEYLILSSLMLLISFADLEDFLIPPQAIILGLINRFVFICIRGNFLSELLSSVIGAIGISLPLYLLVIVMEKILKKDAMGGGDIKLVFMLGSYCSIGQGLLSVLVACIVGLIFALISNKRNEQFPFGPSLCIGYFISILFGTGIVYWYLGLF